LKKVGLAVVVVLVAIGAWYHFASLDGVSGLALRWVLTDDTEFARGYSDAAFRAVHAGMSDAEVLTLLGRPLGEVWMIEAKNSDRCLSVYFENDRIVHGCESRGVVPGMLKADATSRVGRIAGGSWLYSRSPHDTHYRMRVVHLDQGRTTDVLTGWYFD
jgi:hypothetical protein